MNRVLTKPGQYYQLVSGHTPYELLGCVLRTCAHDVCVFVSPGHRLSLLTALKIVMISVQVPSRQHHGKLPLPVFLADQLTRQFMRKYQRDQVWNYIYVHIYIYLFCLFVCFIRIIYICRFATCFEPSSFLSAKSQRQCRNKQSQKKKKNKKEKKKGNQILNNSHNNNTSYFFSVFIQVVSKKKY
ncbi:hypothetical protein RFI_10431 [Reticulomyxa filosa]|uniref:Uncharacterized protein n=1 Tax=Reticulomyxa filosa TaxID=46433 RepID=X6NLB3_RETFI|nr:hypothetical protein RFI_10431 [Reticulomyxa filosa]|eukprot:ETO26703.1 hypothetical protein RFI_10431 [Reticulomyxa filosa]